MPFALHPLYVLSGFAVGFLVGMTGVRGGSLMTPLLILLFHILPTTAVGTDLLYASITKTGGSLVHRFNRTIDWRIETRLAMGSLPAALLAGSLPGIVLASLFAPRLPDLALRLVLAATLTVSGPRLLAA